MIYFDNAATSFPKAPTIKQAFQEYIDGYAVNINRGTYSSSYRLEEKIIETREKVKEFFKADKSYDVVFTSGVTHSLNLFINSVLKNGDEVIVSPLEHNAVMRPLFYLTKIRQIEYKVLLGREKTGAIQESDEYSIKDDLLKNITPSTKAVIINHASNVTGSVSDIYKIGALLKEVNAKRKVENQILFCIDSAGSVGGSDIDVTKSNADFVAFSSHKGLLSIPGSGGAVLKKTLFSSLTPLVFGGTGSRSDSFEMPSTFPDKLEAGTQNIFGILALSKSLDYINDFGFENIVKRKKMLTNYFVDSILNSALQNAFTIEGRDEADRDNYTSVVSLTHKTRDIAEIAYSLDKDYGISIRVGLQCSPLAHKTIGTFDRGGTLRFSFSHFNAEAEIDILLKALRSFL